LSRTEPTYLEEISVGRFAFSRLQVVPGSALSLLVLGVVTNDAHHTAPANHAALVTHLANRSPNLHLFILVHRVDPVASSMTRPWSRF
jgi:hypothetical protein